MTEFLSELLKAQPDTLLLVGGVVLLLIAAVRNISGQIQPGKEGRIVSGLIGLIGPIATVVALWMHWQSMHLPQAG